MKNPIRLTDTHGNVVVPDPEDLLPAGSVVMLHGLEGTAAQRMYVNGDFQTTTGARYSLRDLLDTPNLFLIHVPETDRAEMEN